METEGIMAQNEAVTAKGIAKASVFEDLLSDMDYMMRLHKAFHPEDKDVRIEDLENITPQSVLVNVIYNDLGFMVGDRLLILVEAQSTWSVNIIFRCFLYVAETLKRRYILKEDFIFGTKPIDFPEIELYVIYTGDKNVQSSKITLTNELRGGKKTAIEVEVNVIGAKTQKA